MKNEKDLPEATDEDIEKWLDEIDFDELFDEAVAKMPEEEKEKIRQESQELFSVETIEERMKVLKKYHPERFTKLTSLKHVSAAESLIFKARYIHDNIKFTARF